MPLYLAVVSSRFGKNIRIRHYHKQVYVFVVFYASLNIFLYKLSQITYLLLFVNKIEKFYSCQQFSYKEDNEV